MKIIQGLEDPKPSAGVPAGTGAAPDLGRLEALERIAKTILQKLQALEERVDSIEESRAAQALAPAKAPMAAPVRDPAPAAAFVAPSSPSTADLDTDAVKKGLLTKMWKYLNDEHSPKAA